MRIVYPFIITALLCLLACASGPAPERAPKDIRQSIYYLNKGTAYYTKGCYPKALQYTQEAHERFSVADDIQGAADSLNTLANIYFRLGDYKSALAVYDEAIGLFIQTSNKAAQVRALTNKSAVMIAAGRSGDASRLLDQADSLAEDSAILQGLRLKTRAMLLMTQKDDEAAEGLLREALRISPRSDISLVAGIQYTLAQLLLNTDRPQMAIGHLSKALAIDRDAGAYFSVGLDLAALGACYENQAQYIEAVNHYKRSLKIFAFLEASDKAQAVLPRLEASAGKAGLSIQATLHWAEQWLAGRHESGLCR